MDNAPQMIASIREGIEEYCDAQHNFTFDPANPIVRLHEPTFGAEEIMAAVEVLLSTRVTQGPKVKGFEQEYADVVACKYGVMNNSGSSANLLAVSSLTNPKTEDGLRPGDEVIVPALSWSTTVWPLVECGLVPVVVDIDPETLNIDPEAIERAISPKTRGLMPVHVYGNPCDMDALLDIAKRHNLVLIEDSCESMGAYYDGKPVGSMGRVGTFSFYFSHHICTLEGGICVTNDLDLAEMMRIQRAHGWVRETEDPKKYTAEYPDIDERFLFVNHGFNLRATELQGAMGSVQLPKLAGFVETRQKSAAFWQKELAQYGDLLAMQKTTDKASHSWFGIPVTLKSDAPFTVREMRDFLEARNIETRPIICGNIAAQPAMQLFEHRVAGQLEHASHVMNHAFSFGNHQAIDQNALDYVAEAIGDFIKSC